MAMKVAISVPDPIFDAAERLAKQRRIPRSQLFSEALQDYLSRHGSEAVTSKLNEVYASEDAAVERPLAEAQYASINHEAW
ncbi:ribbon-helix-helix domain-containing protein [soil metagenome]